MAKLTDLEPGQRFRVTSHPDVRGTLLKVSPLSVSIDSSAFYLGLTGKGLLKVEVEPVNEEG